MNDLRAMIVSLLISGISVRRRRRALRSTKRVVKINNYRHRPRLNQCRVCCVARVEPASGVARTLIQDLGPQSPDCLGTESRENEKMSNRLPRDQQGSLRSFCPTFEGPLNPRQSSKVVFSPSACGSHTHGIMWSSGLSHRHGKAG